MGKRRPGNIGNVVVESELSVEQHTKISDRWATTTDGLQVILEPKIVEGRWGKR